MKPGQIETSQTRRCIVGSFFMSVAGELMRIGWLQEKRQFLLGTDCSANFDERFITL